MAGVDKQKYSNISKESKDILYRMKEKRVFGIDIGWKNNELLIGQECEGEYICDELSKEDCLALSNLFSELAECFK